MRFPRVHYVLLSRAVAREFSNKTRLKRYKLALDSTQLYFRTPFPSESQFCASARNLGENFEIQMFVRNFWSGWQLLSNVGTCVVRHRYKHSQPVHQDPTIITISGFPSSQMMPVFAFKCVSAKYICMYIYIHKYIHIRVYVHIYTFMYVYVYIYVYVCMYMYIWIHTNTNTYIHIW